MPGSHPTEGGVPAVYQASESVPSKGSLTATSLITDGHYGVYELAGPEPGQKPDVDIVFFHGLQLEPEANKDAWWTTWQSREEQPCVWPQAWLPDDLRSKYGKTARVLSVCYNASARQDSKSAPTIMPTLARGLFQWLVHDNVDVGGSASGALRRIVLVGHSLGGLIIKQLVREAHDASTISTSATYAPPKRFMDALSGIVFYGTPHHGSSLTDYVTPAFARLLVVPGRLVTDWLSVFSNHTQELNDKFTGIYKRPLNTLMCVAEKRKTKLQLAPSISTLVVPTASAKLAGTFQFEVEADHFGVCKPPSRTDVIYSGFLSHVEEVVQPKVTPMELESIVPVPEWEQQVAKELQGTGVVCLHGLGGSGKSTLSKVIYNQFCNDVTFNGRVCYLQMGKAPSQDWIAALQAKLLDSLGSAADTGSFKQLTVEQRRMMISEAVSRSGTLFLVIDDVWHDIDLANLLPEGMRMIGGSKPDSCFGGTRKSWLLVTARNTGEVMAALSNAAGLSLRDAAGHMACIELTDPSDTVQRAMFLSWSGLASGPLTPEQEYLVREFIPCCHGLPLHLRLLGSLLKKTPNDRRETLLKRLRSFKVSDVTSQEEGPALKSAGGTSILHASLDALDAHVQQLFLDFAVFFPPDIHLQLWPIDGQPSWMAWCRAVTSKYDGNPDSAAFEFIRFDIQQLVDWSLLTWSGDIKEPVRVPNALREYAVQYVQSGQYKDSPVGYKVASKGAVPDNSTRAYVAWDSQRSWSSSSLAELQLMRLENCLYHELHLYLAPKLRVAWITNCHSLTRLELRGLSELRALRVNCSNFSEVRDLSDCTALSALHLHGSLKLTMPESITSLTSLRLLDFGPSEVLHTLPEQISTTLQLLSLGSCIGLKSLPDSLSRLKSLQGLNLSYCTQLESLSSLGSLTALQELNLAGCSSLKSLPDDVFSQLQSLRYINFNGCSQLRSLPTSTTSLTALQQLGLGGCSDLESLSNVASTMQSMKVLDLRGCSKLGSVPPSVGSLTALELLDLQGCSSLTSLPDDVFSQLQSLQRLELAGCSQLRSLPTSTSSLTALQQLGLGGCSDLESLSNVASTMQSMKVLDLRGCSKLGSVPPSVGSLTALELLDLQGCSSLTSLPDDVFSQLQSLQRLELAGCSQLRSLPTSTSSLTALQQLGLGGCSDLESLSNVASTMQSMKVLDLRGCSKLGSVPPSVGSLTALELLDLQGCSSLTSLPDGVFNQLQSLQRLELGGCSQLKSLPPFTSSLTALQLLGFGGCTSLVLSPGMFDRLQSLLLLRLSCSQLDALPASAISSLRALLLVGSNSLQSLPDVFDQFKSLRVLILTGCSELKSLPPSIGSLTALRKLVLDGCTSLERLPEELGQVSSLQILRIHSCDKLTSIRAISNLGRLRALVLTNCTNLEHLPDAFGQLTSLRALDLSGCSKLKFLPASIGNLTELWGVNLGGCGLLGWSDALRHVRIMKFDPGVKGAPPPAMRSQGPISELLSPVTSRCTEPELEPPALSIRIGDLASVANLMPEVVIPKYVLQIEQIIDQQVMPTLAGRY